MRTSLSISARRHFIDKFFFSNAHLIRKDAQVIDIGGKKEQKRGLFDINSTGVEVTYVNIDPSVRPDIIADAAAIPVPDNSYDVAIMGELLEHVPEPLRVLEEAHRILKQNGLLLITVPFMVGIHGDPSDYGRYTETFLREMSKKAGFSKIEIESQGTIFSVMALMIQHIFLAKKVSWRPIQTPLISFLMWLDSRTSNPLLKSWTTGYGIVLTK